MHQILTLERTFLVNNYFHYKKYPYELLGSRVLQLQIFILNYYKHFFTGVTGYIYMDENGTRLIDFSLLDLNPESGEFHVRNTLFFYTWKFLI